MYHHRHPLSYNERAVMEAGAYAYGRRAAGTTRGSGSLGWIVTAIGLLVIYVIVLGIADAIAAGLGWLLVLIAIALIAVLVCARGRIHPDRGVYG